MLLQYQTARTLIYCDYCFRTMRYNKPQRTDTKSDDYDDERQPAAKPPTAPLYRAPRILSATPRAIAIRTLLEGGGGVCAREMRTFLHTKLLCTTIRGIHIVCVEPRARYLCLCVCVCDCGDRSLSAGGNDGWWGAIYLSRYNNLDLYQFIPYVCIHSTI